MKKLSKSYIISNEAKNDNGFRVRTAGIDLSEYNGNPLMLWMHKRPKGERKDEVLPPGNMVDLKVTENTLVGTPCFDETDPFALSLFNKYENGTLRALSAGLIPLKWAKDAKGDIWLEKSKLKEVSLVDLGSNAEALPVTLYNEADELITLSLQDIENTFKPDNTMKLIELSALAVLPLLKLSAEATAEEAQTAIANLVTLADTQATQLITLKTERDDFETKYKDQVKLAAAAKVTSLLDEAVTAGKFVVGDRPNWEKLANTDFDGTKAVLDAMTPNKTVMEQLKKEDGDAALLTLSYDELDKANKLETLKAENLPVFKEKFKTKFGTEYKEN